MLDRIKHLLSTYKLSPAQFADTIGVSRPIVSHILSGRNKPSLEVVQKIVAAFPDLSLPWLLVGTGSMKAQHPLESPEQSSRKPAGSTKASPTSASSQKTSEDASEAKAPLVDAVSPVAPEPVDAAIAVQAPLPSLSSSFDAPAPAITHTPVQQQATQPVDFAVGLADPEKRIRRIVIFYQDGTFSDFKPE